MATKLFCDICDLEVKYSNMYTLDLIDKDGVGLHYRDVCKCCYGMIDEYVKSLTES